ncbi:MAG TPA: TetR/AcrR family transcriptional regulator [Polyangiaceae bacterium]|jgi:AcrR family transcriptional regulator|nr:TetR/AcrR family transcriptional regulator [Polyangiaceae bacterium]
MRVDNGSARRDLSFFDARAEVSAFLRGRVTTVAPMARARANKKSGALSKNEPMRASRRGERRQQILSVAREAFAKRGYHQTTIDDIVAQAGVARGTFYLYFEDKRAVFSDLVDRFAAQLSMAIVRIVTDDPGRTVVEQVRENIRAIIGTCLAERAMTKILFTDAIGVDPAFDRKLQTFYDTVLQLLIQSLKDGQALGIVADGEPRVLAYLTIGALKELLYQAVTLGFAEESADVLTQQMFTFLSGGYLRLAPGEAKDTRKARRR